MTPGISDVVVHADGAKPRTVRVASELLVIGRAPECELAIDDTYVSQQHARIFGKGGSWYVEDLGSTNGTFVNDQRLAAPAMVQAGDKVPHRHHRDGAPTMKVEAGVATDIGRVREGNEDSFLIEPPLYAVADGMGGHRGGEVASQLALETIEELFRKDEGSLVEQVRRRTAPCSCGRRRTGGQRHGDDPHRRAGRRRARLQLATSATAARTCCEPAPFGSSRRTTRWWTGWSGPARSRRRGRGASAPQRADARARHRGRRRGGRGRRRPAGRRPAACCARTGSPPW